MPTVPTLDAPRVSPQAPQAPQASANAFGAGVGRAMQGLGQQVQRSSDAMFEIAEERKRKVQGPKDQLFNATANLRRSETYRNTLNEFSSSGAINDPDYDKKFREVLEKADQDIVKSLLSEGYRPSPEAITRSDLDKLNIQEQFFAQAIAKKDQVEQINIVTGVEENILKIQQTASESGQIDQSHEQIQEALATAKQVMRPEQYARLEADTRAGQGNMVITHLSKLQEYNIDGNASPEQLEGLITQGQAAVDKAVALQYLEPAKAEELKMDFERGVRTRTIQAMEPLKRQRLFTGTTGIGPVADSVASSMDLLRNVEGFRTTPYFDVNHLRGGYGTDTFTHPDGRVEEVTSATRFTKEDAERDLRRRVGEFQDRGRNQTDGKWDSLAPNVQTALTSVLYNYGHLPATVRVAVKSGSTEDIARAVENLDSNKSRRRQEAAIIRGGDVPVGGADNAYTKNLPGDVRQELYQQAISDQQRIDAAELAQLRAAQSQQSDALTLRIEQAQAGRGPMPLHSEIDEMVEANIIDAGQGAAAYQRIGAATEQNKALNLALTQYQNKELDNPFSPDQTKAVNLVYEHWKNTQGMPPSATVDLAKETQIVPTEAVADIRAGINSADIATRAQALMFASQINAAAPNGLEQATNGKEVADAVSAFNTLVGSAEIGGRGMGAEEAARHLMEMASEDTEKIRKRLEHDPPGKARSTLDTFAEKFTSDKLRSLVDTGGWARPFEGRANFATPFAEAQASVEYQEFAREGLVKFHGREDIATNYANEQVKKIWGVSRANSRPEIMKFPPETAGKYPTIDGSHQYFYDDLDRDMATLIGEGETIEERRLVPFATPTGAGTADDIRKNQPASYLVEYIKVKADGTRTVERAPAAFRIDQARIQELANQKRFERIEQLRQDQAEMPKGSGRRQGPVKDTRPDEAAAAAQAQQIRSQWPQAKPGEIVNMGEALSTPAIRKGER